MNLQDFKTLKQDFLNIYYKNNWGEYMLYKEDFYKIMRDFEIAQKNIEPQSREELLKMREQAKENLDIEKIKEIDKKLEEKN